MDSRLLPLGGGGRKSGGSMRLASRIAYIAASVLLLLAFSSGARAQQLSAHEIVRNVQLTPDEETFHVCPPPAGSTVLRLEPPRRCPEETVAREWKEGIGVIFKENISPYKFKATLYYKNIIQTTTWSGTTYKQITSRTSQRVPVETKEIINLIDEVGKCSTKAQYLQNNVMVSAYDKDDRARELDLMPSRFSTHESGAWHTTNDTYTVFGSPWLYRTGTSVNCIAEEVDARSVFPYDYFGLATGDVVDASPFYGYNPPEAANEHMGYAQDRFKQVEGYFPIDLNTKEKSKSPVKRNWVTTQSYTVAWDWYPRKQRICSMAHWKTVDEMLSATYPGGRLRFTAKGLSATFISNVTELDPDRIKLGHCVRDETEDIVEEVFNAKYNATHVRSGGIKYYLLVGGFVLGYQPILSRTLAGMYIRELINDNRTDLALDLLHKQKEAAPDGSGGNGTSSSASGGGGSLSRLRRNAVENGLTEDSVIKSTSDVQFAMLQFVYDNLQQHMNDMFSRLATAWCELQNRETVLWQEGLKLNPSAVATANLGRRVGARVLGDVVAVSTCLTVDASSVTLQNSMRSTVSTNTCYSRPLVLFSYKPGGEKIEGQLGENNELLPSAELIEPCTANQRRYFLFGTTYALFEHYSFVRMVDISDVELLSTFVELNITLLEDREILPLTVYTKEELRDVGVLDYSEVSRRNQLHDLKFYDIDKVIEVDTNYAFMSGLADIFSGLGAAGKAVGKVIVGAAGAVVSAVSGIASFIANPFGGLAIGLLVIAAIVAAFVAYRYISKLKSNPMKTLYPMTTKALKDEEEKLRSGEGGEGDDDEEFDEEKLEKAREMIKYMTMLSAEERQAKKMAKRGNKGTSARLSRHLNNMRLRAVGKKKGGGNNYDRLENETDLEEEDELDNYSDLRLV